MQRLARYKRNGCAGPGCAWPVHLKNGFYVKNKGFFTQMKFFKKSIVKLLERCSFTLSDRRLLLASLAITFCTTPGLVFWVRRVLENGFDLLYWYSSSYTYYSALLLAWFSDSKESREWFWFSIMVAGFLCIIFCTTLSLVFWVKNPCEYFLSSVMVVGFLCILVCTSLVWSYESKGS